MNPIPRWWTTLFTLSVATALLYLFFVTLAGHELSARSAYDRESIAELKRQGGALKPDAETLLRLYKDPDTLKVGATIFTTNCISCHGRAGEGLTGPNLTDDAYLHVQQIQDIPDVVTKGRNNGAMPPWGPRLSPNEIVQVSAYVASLRGTHAQGKPPEGKPISPWEPK